MSITPHNCNVMDIITVLDNVKASPCVLGNFALTDSVALTVFFDNDTDSFLAVTCTEDGFLWDNAFIALSDGGLFLLKDGASAVFIPRIEYGKPTINRGLTADWKFESMSMAEAIPPWQLAFSDNQYMDAELRLAKLIFSEFGFDKVFAAAVAKGNLLLTTF